MHLRCAGIRLAHYTDTRTCQLHKESGLTTQTDNTTPPLQTLVQSLYPLPTYASHTTATQTHVQHSPCSHRIGKAQTLTSHPFTPSPPTPPQAKHIHISHTPPTPLTLRTTFIPSMPAASDTIPEPRIPPQALHSPQPHLLHPHTVPSPWHLQILSLYTHETQATVYASQSPQPPHPHRVQRQPHRQTKYDHMTTDTTQAHRPSS